MTRVAGLYAKLVFDRPKATLVVVMLVVALFGAHIPDFRLDASSDSLVLENDDALRYYRGDPYSFRERRLLDRDVLAERPAL